MHICLVSHGCHRHDGQARVNYEIVKGLLGRGWRVTFIGAELAEDLQNEPLLRWIRKSRPKLATNLMKNLVFSVKTSIALRSIRRTVDITHATGFVVWLKTDLNTVHFVHSGWLSSKAFPYRPTASAYYFYQFVYTVVNSVLERVALAQTGKLIAVSDAVKQELEQVNRDYRITVVHNGVDTDEFHPGPSERDKFGLAEGRRLFLFAGDIRTPRKNLGTVLKAMTKVINAELVVAGDLKGSPYPTLADKLGLQGRVHFLGRVAKMPGLMRSVDMFVFPSRYEAMSLAILEALASGLPVITASTSGGVEVIGGAGIVLQDPDDAQALASAMQSLADDDARRSTMAMEARRVATSLSWKNMTEQYVKCYEGEIRNAH